MSNTADDLNAVVGDDEPLSSIVEDIVTGIVEAAVAHVSPPNHQSTCSGTPTVTTSTVVATALEKEPTRKDHLSGDFKNEETTPCRPSVAPSTSFTAPAPSISPGVHIDLTEPDPQAQGESEKNVSPRHGEEEGYGGRSNDGGGTGLEDDVEDVDAVVTDIVRDIIDQAVASVYQQRKLGLQNFPSEEGGNPGPGPGVGESIGVGVVIAEALAKSARRAADGADVPVIVISSDDDDDNCGRGSGDFVRILMKHSRRPAIIDSAGAGPAPSSQDGGASPPQDRKRKWDRGKDIDFARYALPRIRRRRYDRELSTSSSSSSSSDDQNRKRKRKREPAQVIDLTIDSDSEEESDEEESDEEEMGLREQRHGGLSSTTSRWNGVGAGGARHGGHSTNRPWIKYKHLSKTKTKRAKTTATPTSQKISTGRVGKAAAAAAAAKRRGKQWKYPLNESAGGPRGMKGEGQHRQFQASGKHTRFN